MKGEIVAFIQTERGGVQLNKKVASTIAEYLVEVCMVEDVNEVKSNLKSLKSQAEEACPLSGSKCVQRL